MQPYNLKHKYGVVRFVGTLRHNRNHELVFESDNPLEAMNELERLCVDDDGVHGHTLIIR
jgi:hypothetical protein